MATTQEKTTPDPSLDPTRNTTSLDSFPPKTTPTTKGFIFTLFLATSHFDLTFFILLLE
jgi:hypothetical protein